jgi:hypothetical protein
MKKEYKRKVQPKHFEKETGRTKYLEGLLDFWICVLENDGEGSRWK